MFGIGKKNEAQKIATIEVGKNTTEDEIQFDFEEDDKLPFDDEGFADEHVGENESPPGRLRQPLSTRTLLLALLLLVALGGAGYYYLNSTPVLPHEPAAPVKSKIAVQPAPTAAAAVRPESPLPVAAAPTREQQAAPAVQGKAVPVAKTPAPTTVAAAPAEVKMEVLSPPATHQPFTLSVGTFVNQKNQREVEKTIRRLGYTPKVKSTFTMVPMTRLRLGVYDPATAQARHRELSAQLPGLFAMKQGNKVALYAGSFQSLDQARSFADRLYLRGILVDEETTSLRMPVKNISYGSFASRAAAEKAVKRAAKAGLTVQVVKR